MRDACGEPLASAPRASTCPERPDTLYAMLFDARGPLRRRADDGGEGDGGLDLDAWLGTGDRGARIRCPRCRWQPRAHDRWQCECLHVWNTFDTRGRCPACATQWKVTQCLRCLSLSPHDDWYEERADP